MATFPDYGKATAEYVIAIADAISWMTDAEIDALMDPRDGYVANADGYLPSVGKLHEFLRNKQAKADQFKSHPTSGYKRLMDETPDPRPPTLEERKAVVLRELGYDPQQRTSPKRDLVPPTSADLDGVVKGLKTPAAPPSDELKRMIAEQDAR